MRRAPVARQTREQGSTIREDRAKYRIDIIDDDPLRARREARELLGEIADADPHAELDLPQQRLPDDESVKGGITVEAVSLLIGSGSMVAAGVQVWLARVPQRTIIAVRPDGATLRITGREARADDERIDRFLAGDSDDSGAGEDGDGTAG